MNNIQQLAEVGQSIWYDNISRSLIRDGGLDALIAQGLRGVTSNPSIFEAAIAKSDDYDEQIRALLAADPDMDTADMIKALMIEDITQAADRLRSVFDATGGLDGYVSIEVDPRKARDTTGTIEEVRELWSRIDRPNLMVKIPATMEGLPAIQTAIREGVNINVTLIFSRARYLEVAEAYIRGLEERMADGHPVDHVASVASVFVSRIDSAIDRALGDEHELAGKIAIANTKGVYQAFKDRFEGERFASLREAGARVQRPLWASTGTKNPSFSKVLYVDELIAASTVNTVPPATYDAILEQSQISLRIENDVQQAMAQIDALADAGIDYQQVLATLEDQGVAAFEKSFDGLTAKLDAKRMNLAD